MPRPPSRPAPGSRLWPWGRAAAPSDELDPADVGTAFGLDLAQPDDPVEAPSATSPATASGWRARLTGRGGSDPRR
jgi:hypothetical protein